MAKWIVSKISGEIATPIKSASAKDMVEAINAHDKTVEDTRRALSDFKLVKVADGVVLTRRADKPEEADGK